MHMILGINEKCNLQEIYICTLWNSGEKNFSYSIVKNLISFSYGVRWCTYRLFPFQGLMLVEITKDLIKFQS